MSERILRLPHLNTNDDSAVLVSWLVADGSPVSAGTAVAVVETTKTTQELEAGCAGYCARLLDVGARIGSGDPLAVILARPDERPETYLAAQGPGTERGEGRESGEKRWTKKAALVAAKRGLDIEALADKLGRKVGEADVIAAQRPEDALRDLVEDAYPHGRRERVLLVGGGGGGGAITLDAIMRTHHQRAVGILDNNSALHGKTQLGVPILGNNALAHSLWAEGFFDAAIIVVTASIAEREGLFHELSRAGIRFTNVIDPSVDIRSNVVMGVGNLIMAHGFLATCVSLGDNNFFASHSCIEHHSRIGSHCTFGPRTTTSGAVNIGDRVKTGMGVLIEPYLEIGDDVLIPSGTVVASPIPANSVIKHADNSVIRPR